MTVPVALDQCAGIVNRGEAHLPLVLGHVDLLLVVAVVSDVACFAENLSSCFDFRVFEVNGRILVGMIIQLDGGVR